MLEADLDQESLRHGAGVFGHSHGLEGLESPSAQHNSLAEDMHPSEQDGHMNSLAFELAQASPTGGAPSSLAAELGLEEVDHEQEFDDSLSAIEDQQQSDREDDEQQQQQQHEPGTPARHQTTPVKLRSSASKATLRHSPSFQTSPKPQKPSVITLDHIDFDKFDAELASSTETIRADLQAMSSFLSSLSTYTSDVPSTIEPQGKAADRQLFLERLTSDVIRSMYSMSKERESQLRELHDISRQANKSEPDWIEALAELEPLPVVDWQLFTVPSASSATAAATPSTSASKHQQQQLNSIGEEPEEASASGSTNLYPSSSLPTPSITEPASPLLETTPTATTSTKQRSSPLLHSDMSTLRRQTSDVISSLSGINEHIQVHRAGLNESGRKLKSLKAALTNIKAEADTVHQCIDFVDGWEALHYPPDQTPALDEGAEGQFARHAKGEMDAAKDLLDQAGERAQSMLRDPA